MQEAVLDLAVEQALSPALRQVSESFVGVMLEHGIPLEAILTELFLSGEVERTYRLLRTRGLRRADGAPLADQPVRPAVARGRVRPPRRRRPRCASSSTTSPSGRFADEWDAERDAGFADVRATQGGRGRPGHRRLRGATSAPSSASPRRRSVTLLQQMRAYWRTAFTARRLRSLPVGSAELVDEADLSRGT